MANSFITKAHLLATGDSAPDTDDTVGVAGIEGGAVGGPGQGSAARLAGERTEVSGVGWVALGNNLLGLQVPDHDAIIGTSAQPVVVGREAQGVDGGTVGVEAVELLALTQVPKDGLAVTATRSAERAVWRNSDGGDIASVTNQGSAKLAGSQVPDLNLLVAATRNDDGISSVG